MYVRLTQPAVNLLAEWHRICLEMNMYNQNAFNRVFSALRKSLNYTIMPKTLYPHGLLIEEVWAPYDSFDTVVTSRLFFYLLRKALRLVCIVPDIWAHIAHQDQRYAHITVSRHVISHDHQEVCVRRCSMCTTQMPICIQLGLTRLGFMQTTAWATTTSSNSSWIGWSGRSTCHPLPFPYATKQLTISCHCMRSAVLFGRSGIQAK